MYKQRYFAGPDRGMGRTDSRLLFDDLSPEDTEANADMIDDF
jgi:hypothetical protein